MGHTEARQVQVHEMPDVWRHWQTESEAMNKPDATKGDTQKIEPGPRWRDTGNHFNVRRRGPTCPLLFDVVGDNGKAVQVGITPELANNLAAWLVTITGVKPVEFLELVHHIKT